MKFLLHSLLFLLFCVSSPAATGDVIIDVLGASGKRVAVTVPKTNDYVIGFDGSGNVVAKAGSGGVTWNDITGKPPFGTLATQNGTITDYLTTATAASTYQPLDGDLTSIAALATTSFGRGLLTLADAAALRTAAAAQANLVSGTNIKTVNGNSLLGSGNLTITGDPLVTTSSTGGYGRIGLWDAGNSAFNYLTATNGGFEFGSGLTVKASSFEGEGGDITNIAANNIASGTLSGSRLPAPTTTTLGGVLRNTGTAGQYVTGIATNGVLQYGTPPGVHPLVTTGDTGSGYGRIGLYDDDAGVFRYLEATATGRISFPTSVEASFFYGNGSQLTNLNAGSITTGTLPVARGGVDPLVTTGDNGSGYGRIGLWDGDNGDWIYFSAGPSKIIFPDIQATSLSGSGNQITNLNAGQLTSGTLPASRLPIVPVANGGTNLNAAGASGNVLTSDGTTWTSTAPANNPAGTGSELQFRSSATTFGRVQNSSVIGPAITLGVANGTGLTSENFLILRNTSAATSVLQQVSPSIAFEARGWKTDATATSQTVRFRQNILPVLGAANPSVTWRLQSEINNSGTWVDALNVNSAGQTTLIGGTVTTNTPVLNLSQTWNNAGVAFTGSVLNIVNTNSSPSSVLEEWQVNGVRSLAIQADAFGRISGSTISSGFAFNGQGANRMSIYAGGNLLCYLSPTDFGLRGNAAIRWDSTGGDPNSTGNGLSILRDNQNHILGQRVSANPQTSNIYNTYTDTSNYERGFKRWRGSQFTATISGTTMTLTVASVGTFAVGQRIAGTGVTAGTVINSLASGTLGAVGSTYTLSTSQTVATATVMNSYSDVYEIGTERLGTGTARALSFLTDGTPRWNIDTQGRLVSQMAGAGAGIFSYFEGGFNLVAFANSTTAVARFYADSGHARISTTETSLVLEVPRLTFGGVTSSFPALKRSGTTLQVRLADDSGFAPLEAASLNLPKTITAAGTPGNRTINQPSGSVNFAAAATSLVVSNTLVTANSVIQISKGTDDATARLGAVVAGAGSFTIYMDVAPTAETRVNFTITN